MENGDINEWQVAISGTRPEVPAENNPEKAAGVMGLGAHGAFVVAVVASVVELV